MLMLYKQVNNAYTGLPSKYRERAIHAILPRDTDVLTNPGIVVTHIDQKGSKSHARRLRRAANKVQQLLKKQLLTLDAAYVACLAFEVSATRAKIDEAYKVGLQVKTYRGVLTSDIAHLKEQITIVQSKLDCAMAPNTDGYNDTIPWGVIVA